MDAEIIAIGSELTSGAKLDTNSQWLSLQLAEIGITVKFHTTVADDLQGNIDALKIAADRVDIILLTGGLGPTLDDLTRHAVAGLLLCKLHDIAENILTHTAQRHAAQYLLLAPPDFLRIIIQCAGLIVCGCHRGIVRAAIRVSSHR